MTRASADRRRIPDDDPVTQSAAATPLGVATEPHDHYPAGRSGQLRPRQGGLSYSTYTVSNGSITMQISSLNSTYGDHLTLTPVSSSANSVMVTSPGSQCGTVGTSINGVQLHAKDSACGPTPTFSATGLPTGLSISSFGLISGAPSASGSFDVTVMAPGVDRRVRVGHLTPLETRERLRGEHTLAA